MKPSLGWMLGLTMAMLGGYACAQATPDEALLVLSKQDHTLAIVDPASLRVVARIPVGNDPHEAAASADGATAYVSNYGFGAFHTIAVVDLVHQKPLPAIDLGALRGPHGLVFRDGKLWFTAEAARSIGSYSPATGQIDWVMGIGQNRPLAIFMPSHTPCQSECVMKPSNGVNPPIPSMMISPFSRELTFTLGSALARASSAFCTSPSSSSGLRLPPPCGLTSAIVSVLPVWFLDWTEG